VTCQYNNGFEVNGVKRKFVQETESEEYLHLAAWAVVGRQFENSENQPGGSIYDDLVAMVFAFHAFEGYLNFIGDKIAPELWSNERKTFRGTGITEKLKVICERCSISAPNMGSRPYSTLSELKKLRDGMAHPKIYKAPPTKTELPESATRVVFPKILLEKLVSHERALRARDDVKQIADEIHAAALARFPHAGLGPRALDGVYSTHTTSTRLIE
jgi:hypothetical protein